MPIQEYDTIVSTTIIGKKTLSGVPIASFTAIMFALPPIQEADNAPNPDQLSGGSQGLKSQTTSGAPAITPITVAVIMISAGRPSFTIAGRSDEIRSRMIPAGRRFMVIAG